MTLPPDRDAAEAAPTAGAVNVVRSIRTVACLLAVLLHGLLFEIWLRIVIGRRYGGDARTKIAALNRVIRLWGVTSFSLVRALLGLHVRIEGGSPRAGRFVVISNHQSSLDPSFLATAFPALNLKFAAKEELRRGKPAVSVGLRHGGSVFVGQDDVRKDLAVLIRFGRQMERFDGSPVLFPEGQRTEDGSLGSLRSGGIEAVRRASGLPLIAVTIDGLWQARTIWAWRRIVGAQVTMRISRPFPPEEVDRDPRRTYQEIEEIMRRNLAEIRRSAGDPTPVLGRSDAG